MSMERLLVIVVISIIVIVLLVFLVRVVGGGSGDVMGATVAALPLRLQSRLRRLAA